MEVIHGLDKVKNDPTSSLTVGSFDGLHLGHQRIIQHMRKLSNSLTVLTFYPHPQSIVRQDQSPLPLLTSYEERYALFQKIGVDRLIIAEFDKAFAEMKPEEFVEELLVKKIGLSYIFVGPNHKFGKNRKGDVKVLQEQGEKFGFEVQVVDPVNRFAKKISSSRIRELLLEGDPLTAWRCLGRPYYIDGTVIEGERRGKKLGFPTANVRSTEPNKLVPYPGIYCTITEVDGYRWPSVSHFGPRPTFRETKPVMETFIIGFRKEIYGKQIRVGLIDRLRDIMTFTTPAELVGQLRADVRGSIQRLAELGFGNNARLRIQRFGRVLL